MADPVYVRIERPEGYEDVCSELVIEDAIPSTAFHIADATAEVARLRKALKEIDQKTGHFGEAPPPPEWMPMLSLIAWVGRTARAALAGQEVARG